MTATIQPTSQRLRNHSAFRNLWLGLTASELGTQINQLALPLVAVLALRATSGQVGFLAALVQLPYIVLSLFFGVLVDRLSPRMMLITADLSRLVFLGILPVLYWLHIITIYWLYGIAFMVGTGAVLFDVASQTYLPQIVTPDQLAAGNGALEASRSGSILAGPSLAGLLAQIFTAPVALLASSFAYLGSVIAVWCTPRSGNNRSRDQPVESGGVLQQIWSGLRLVFGNEILRVMAVVAGLYNLFYAGFQTVNLLFLARELRLSASAIGIVLGSVGPGLLIGAAVAAKLPQKVGYGKAIFFTAIGANGVIQFIPAVHGNGAVSVFFLVLINVIVGTTGLAHTIIMRTIRQVMTPRNSQGRVAATNRFVAQGASPIGSLLGGFLASVLSLRLALFSMTLGMLSILFILAFSSLVRIGKTLPQLDSANQAT